MSIQLAATRRALEAVVEALTEQTGEDLQDTCNHYVEQAKARILDTIPPGRRRITALRTGGFLVRS